jgi:putative FmdB family regulatory protein
MPIYEYRCTNCSKEFELFQKITDEPATECPDCGGKIERLVSATTFSLKGGGWYKDGYSSSKSETPKKEIKKDTTKKKE